MHDSLHQIGFKRAFLLSFIPAWMKPFTREGRLFTATFKHYFERADHDQIANQIHNGDLIGGLMQTAANASMNFFPSFCAAIERERVPLLQAIARSPNPYTVFNFGDIIHRGLTHDGMHSIVAEIFPSLAETKTAKMNDKEALMICRGKLIEKVSLEAMMRKDMQEFMKLLIENPAVIPFDQHRIGRLLHEFIDSFTAEPTKFNTVALKLAIPNGDDQSVGWHLGAIGGALILYNLGAVEKTAFCRFMDEFDSLIRQAIGG